jgi:tetratricopeptide (TPR) repeat protein
MKLIQRVIKWATALVLVASATIRLAAADTNLTAKVEEPSGSNDMLRSVLQLQEQLHSTQQALERNREESERLAARNAEAVATKLQLIEQAVIAQRTADHTAMQSANRLMLWFAGTFAGVGFVAMVLTAYLQWRAVNRLTQFAALLPAAGHAPLQLSGQAESQLLGAAEQSGNRLFGALNRLEQRIHELEHTSHAPLAEKTSNGANATSSAQTGPEDHITLLLAKGESLLNLDKAEEALVCYDKILAEHPDHPEALVKKGVALEQLRQMDDALLCYDRAIAADGSLTVAYLQKGGLFNRLERYEEALQCYEQALKTQEKVRE